MEKTVLTAKGAGIVRILPLTLDLAKSKRHHNNIKTEFQTIVKNAQIEVGNRLALCLTVLGARFKKDRYSIYWY